MRIPNTVFTSLLENIGLSSQGFKHHPPEGFMLNQKLNKSNKLAIIVIGSGSVGVRFVNELIYKQPGAFIKVFGGEEQQPYSRENLTKLLSGDLTEERLYSTNKIHESKNTQVFLNNPIVEVDTKNDIVIDSHGEQHAYEKLVLAVGSFPRNMDIPGTDLKHVFTFRNIQDAEMLKNRQISSRKTVVVGGGLVGLDAAYAMKQYNTEVVVIENSTRLMYQLLDDHASVYLRLYLDDLDIDVRIETDITSIEGKNKVEKVTLSNGETIECDTVIISIGIIPNTDLAKNIGLKINRGIVVDDFLKTSVENIYAIGECAEHRDRIYGIVQPGFDQAATLAKIIAGGKSKYTGTTTASQLRVVEYPVLSIGDNGEGDAVNKEIMYRDIRKMIYRKIVLKHGHLTGVIATGPWKNSKNLHELVEKKQFIWPWKRSKFERTGEL